MFQVSVLRVLGILISKEQISANTSKVIPRTWVFVASKLSEYKSIKLKQCFKRATDEIQPISLQATQQPTNILSTCNAWLQQLLKLPSEIPWAWNRHLNREKIKLIGLDFKAMNNSLYACKKKSISTSSTIKRDNFFEEVKQICDGLDQNCAWEL